MFAHRCQLVRELTTSALAPKTLACATCRLIVTMAILALSTLASLIARVVVAHSHLAILAPFVVQSMDLVISMRSAMARARLVLPIRSNRAANVATQQMFAISLQFATANRLLVLEIHSKHRRSFVEHRIRVRCAMVPNIALDSVLLVHLIQQRRQRTRRATITTCARSLRLALATVFALVC